MRYLLMMWSGAGAETGTAEDLAAWVEYDRALRAAGVLIEGDALHAPASARLVSTRLGGHEPGTVAAGSYPDAELQFNGFYLLECPDQATAEEWAYAMPTYGPVEVRRLMEFDLQRYP